ncbi:MAG: carotenoid oxygenase family protein [Acidimicrobiales bacterium]
MLTQERLTTEGWRLGFRTLENEIEGPTELAVRGELPAELSGTLYRIGPARHDVHGERYRHWFDGDGMVHALGLSGGVATYRNRFVRTAKKADEDAAGRRLYAGFGTPAAGGALARFRQARSSPPSAANTNVVFHGGRLLALWEGGRPWRLDPVTLETMGEEDLGGALAPGAAWSAHPKVDAATGELWNFGVTYGRRTWLSLYRSGPDGATTRVCRVRLPFGAMIHDFALTPTKVAVVVPPIALPPVPVALLAGRRSFGESLRWKPELGTRIVVIDRTSLEVKWYRTDPFMVFHTVNAFDEGDDVVVDLCSYPDDSVMRFLTEVMVGRIRSEASAWPERLRLAPDGTAERRRLSATMVEFPRVLDAVSSGEHRRFYGIRSGEAEFPGVPVAVDVASGRSQSAPMGPGQFAGECVPVPKAGARARDESEVWLLTVVLDANAARSELRVLDGADLAAPPVAVVPLPHVVPFGFHGSWVGSVG